MIKTFVTKAKKLQNGLQVETDTGKFKILFDEPVAMGGTGEAPDPIDGLLSSLAACQVIVATMFAKAKKFTFEEFYVEVEGDQDMDGVMHKTDIRPGLLEIRYKMHFKTNEPKEKVEEFAHFVEMTCPVSDTLRTGTILKNTGIIIE